MIQLVISTMHISLSYSPGLKNGWCQEKLMAMAKMLKSRLIHAASAAGMAMADMAEIMAA